MKKLSLLAASVLVVLSLTPGCRTTITVDTPAEPEKVEMKAEATSLMGKSIQEALATYESVDREYFNVNGEKLDAMPTKDAGSVSIYNSERTEQDNISFDESGTVTKHLRSSGEDYAAGKWVEVK